MHALNSRRKSPRSLHTQALAGRAAWLAIGLILAAGSATPAHADQAERRTAPCLHRSRFEVADAGASAATRGQCGLEWVNPVANPGMNDVVYALTVFDDGNGPRLYAGGNFTSANGVSANRVARWNGTSWSALGAGVDLVVLGLGVFDPPGAAQGPGLYACGSFDFAGGNLALSIARWNGLAWSPLGSGTFGTVDRMTVHDEGSGPALYVTGQFTSIGGVANTSRVARWNGSAWSALSTGFEDTGNDLISWDEDGSGPNGPRLFGGGYFVAAGDTEIHYMARWDGAAWSDVGGVSALNEHVHAFHVFDDGTGPALYVGGFLTVAGGIPVRGIARWNGSAWSALANGLNDEVLTITSFDDGSGSGPQLYVGGFFTATFEGVPAQHVAKWTGSSWVGLNTGLNDAVWSLTTFDDGQGAGHALYAGGWFLTAGGQTSRRVAQWNGVGTGPSISAHPDGVSVSAGEAAVFTVTAAGTPPLSYQWRKGGVDLSDGGGVSGATTAMLTIDPVVPGNAGSYDVVVTNDCDSATSDPATLEVIGFPCQDLDTDGDVDLDDYALWADCLSGPAGGIAPGCEAADCDADQDVDLTEFALFQAAL